MRLTVYQPVPVSQAHFVNFWSDLYHDPRQCAYEELIHQPLTPTTAKKLFCWRSKTGYTRPQHQLIEQEFTSKVYLLKKIPRNTSPEGFLMRFPRGGPMLRTFWLHLWQPDRYPLFDSHIHRGVCHVLAIEHQELSTLGEMGQLHAYLDLYLLLHQSFKNTEARKTDHAFHALGKFLSRYPFTHH